MNDNYFNQLEETAQRARNVNSFRDYRENSATNEYYSYTAHADQIAAEAISRLEKANAPQERIDKVNYLLEKYKEKKSEWLLDYYRCEASCPSIMISGGSNFPVRKKEQQNARRRAIRESDPDYILDQIKSVADNAHTIYSDDGNAVERLKEKIAKEEKEHEYKMRGNAYYRKNGTIKGFEGIEDAVAEKIESQKFWQGWQPFMTINDTANIRRLKERLLTLSPAEIKAEKVITINGIEATYKSIISLFDSVKPSKSVWDDETRYYIELPLTFSDGTRKYTAFLQFETDENGATMHTYGNSDNGYKSIFIPLTDERKFYKVIAEISGSGNKAVIYSILKDLLPKNEAKEAAAVQRESEATINGENIRIERNTEITRLQIFFDGIPQPETRQIMKSNGFVWSPSQKAWQRLLNNNAEYALKRLLK